MSDDRALRLEVTGADELLPWLTVSGWETIEELDVRLESIRPRLAALDAFLTSPQLDRLRRLQIKAPEPMSSKAIAAIARLPALEALELEDMAGLDPQVVRLAAAGPNGLRCLRLMGRELSAEGCEALANACFRERLEELVIGCDVDERGFAAIARASWPRLRRVQFGTVHGSEAELAAAPPPFATSWLIAGDARMIPTHRCLATTVLERLAEPPSRRGFAHALELLSRYDDEGFESELATRCEAAVVHWPANERHVMWHAEMRRWTPRPFWALVRSVELVDGSVPLLPAVTRLVIVDGRSLPDLDLATNAPALETLVVHDGIGHLLERWRLPGTIRELDLGDYRGELFPRDGYIQPFRAKLDGRLPFARIRLPAWCTRNSAVRFELGSPDRDGWYDPHARS